jgi:cation diffusion facilitator CzcD-associated flavoprotein CzcO
MLQRSPTYIVPGPAVDKIGSALKKYLGDRMGYMATRWKNVLLGSIMYPLIRRYPDNARKLVRNLNIRSLPDGYDVDKHLNPNYNPWDQRMCVAPEGDFFKAISSGKASIATDHVKRFTRKGIELESGESLDADIVVTATGLRMVMLGGMDVIVDGRPLVIGDTLAYRGSMLEAVPNLVFTIGYTNASWTLKADLVSEFVCRILKEMDSSGNNVCVPVNEDPNLERGPLMDFAAGYVLRTRNDFPTAGARQPWRLGMNYIQDLVTLRHKNLDDGALRFSRSSVAPIRMAQVPTQRAAEVENDKAASGL